jgi:nicotinic acid mononucleotide adenylyltransferase
MKHLDKIPTEIIFYNAKKKPSKSFTLNLETRQEILKRILKRESRERISSFISSKIDHSYSADKFSKDFSVILSIIKNEDEENKFQR